MPEHIVNQVTANSEQGENQRYIPIHRNREMPDERLTLTPDMEVLLISQAD